MCGIFCAFGIAQGASKASSHLCECAQTLKHRGPDHTGFYAQDKTVMVHHRLAIVGVAESGNQPLVLEKKDGKRVLLISNGEIYNHKALRAALKDPRRVFKSDSDAEVLAHLYDEACDEAQATGTVPDHRTWLNRVMGSYAFAVYDESRQLGFVARDHIGIVPLYVGYGADGSVWFASELKALAKDCARIEEFPPGHFSTGTGAFTRWYLPSWYNDDVADRSLLPTTPVDIDRLRAEFEAAVVRRLMCDVPFGVLLSGGLDSSLVSAIVCRYAQRRIEDPTGRAPAHFPRIHSFSIGLPGSPDLAAAQKVAQFLNTEHHAITFTPEEGINAIKDVIYHLETYDVTTTRASTPMYLMSRRIKAMGIKMVLSGEGSDEVFGGYLYFHKAPNKEEFHRETVRKVKALNKFDCLRANKSTAAWGLEVRVPFLDQQFLQYAMTIDPAVKMIDKQSQPPRIEKWVLRKAFEGYIPDEILWRQKEQFSDGVGYNWIDSLKAHAEKMVSDIELKSAPEVFPVGTPSTKEAFWYRSIFSKHFPAHVAELVPCGPSIACSTPIAIAWDEAFRNAADPSGRAVAGVHNEAAVSSSNHVAMAKSQNGVKVEQPLGATAVFATNGHSN